MDEQTDKSRSRYIFPSGCTFVNKKSWTLETAFKNAERTEVVTQSGQMTADMNTSSWTPVQAKETANALTHEWPQSFCMSTVKTQSLNC